MPSTINYGLTKLTTCIGLSLPGGKAAIIVDAREDHPVDAAEWDALCLTYGMDDETPWDYHTSGAIGIYVFDVIA